MAEIDLYAIGVDLIISDGINGQIDGIISAFETLQGVIDGVNKSLALTGDVIGHIVTASADMAASWRAAATAAGRLADYTDRISHSTATITPMVVPDAPGKPRDAVAAGGGGHQGVSAWDYIIGGGVAYSIGKDAVTGAYDQGADLQHQKILLKNLGAGTDAQDQAQAAAIQLQQQYPGLSLDNAMTIIRDAYTQSTDSTGRRSMPIALQMANALATSAYVLQGYGDDDAAAEIFSLSRSADLKGLLNAKNPDGSPNMTPFENFVSAFTSAAVSSGGRISPNDALNILKTSGAEGQMMDQQAMTTALLMGQFLGAPQVGTGINALATEFLGGKMSQGAAQNLHRAGLLPDDMFDPATGKILDKYKNGLGNVLLPPGAVKNVAEFEADPFKWIQDTFDPAVAGMDPADKAQLLGAIYGDISRIPGARVAAEAILQDPLLTKQALAAAGIADPTQLAANMKQDPKNISSGFVQAFDALMATLGSDAMPTTTAQLKGLTGALNDLDGWAQRHPNAGNQVGALTESAMEGGAGILSFGIIKMVGKMLGVGGGAGAAGGAGGEAAGLAAGAAAGGPPGWLIAAISEAVVAGVNALEADRAAGLAAGGKETTVRGRFGPVEVVLAPNSGPMPVTVSNGKSLWQGLVGGLEQALNSNPTGPTGTNNQQAPQYPGIDSPGSYTP